MSVQEEIAFCMIPIKDKEGNLSIFPLPSDHCHCKTSDKKHFSLYGKFNEEKTEMTPTNQEDITRLEEYYKELTKA